MIHSGIHNQLPAILQACIEASKAIMEVYTKDIFEIEKSDGSPVTKADLISNEIINAALAKTNIPVITEENQLEPYATRQNWEYVWLVDPLDGTREFIKKNDEFVICIALIHKQKSILGIITSPVNQEILIGGSIFDPVIIPFAAINEKDKWQPIVPKQSISHAVVVSGSRSHETGVEVNFNQKIRSSFPEVHFKRVGSALKFFDLALGTADVYPRFAPTMEWDIAAGQAIIEALGGDVIHPELRTPLTYNKEDLYNPHFIVRTKALIDHLNT